MRVCERYTPPIGQRLLIHTLLARCDRRSGTLCPTQPLVKANMWYLWAFEFMLKMGQELRCILEKGRGKGNDREEKYPFHILRYPSTGSVSWVVSLWADLSPLNVLFHYDGFQRVCGMDLKTGTRARIYVHHSLRYKRCGLRWL